MINVADQKTSSAETEAKPKAILLLFDCSEVNNNKWCY